MEILTSGLQNTEFCWNLSQCRLVNSYLYFEGAFCLQTSGKRSVRTRIFYPKGEGTALLRDLGRLWNTIELPSLQDIVFSFTDKSSNNFIYLFISS
jgi:hypothetical protein